MRLVVLERPESLEGAYQQEEFELDFDENMPVIRIGRQLTNDITLLDFSVSRRHVELSPQNGGLLVQDLNSSNGTYINDRPVPPKGQAVIKPGDKLRLGRALLRLEGNPFAQINQSLGLLDAALEQSRQKTEQALSSPPPLTPQPRLEDLFMPVAPLQPKFEEQLLSPQPSQAEPVYATQKVNLPPEARFPQVQPLPPVQPLPFQDASALPAPEQVLKKRRQPSTTPHHTKGMWLVTLLVIILLVASVVLIGASLWVFTGTSTSSPTVIPLPTATFSGATRNEQALGLAITVPDDWRRNDSEPSKVVFNFPDSTLAAFTVEKPPSSSVPQIDVNPEEAIRLYLANVRRVGQNVRVLINPASTFLRDGTKAFSTRVVFSTTTAPIVKDYVVYAVSFNCNSTLYFVTIGDEESSFRDIHKQNLEATLNSLACR
jgi:hypothetical protein